VSSRAIAARTRYCEHSRSTGDCLNLVTNAVITWNTVYMTKVLNALRDDGTSVSDDLAHLAPTLRAHINPYGKYNFDVDSGIARTGFRPLREPAASASA
jgi:hypothetical protein